MAFMWLVSNMPGVYVINWLLYNNVSKIHIYSKFLKCTPVYSRYSRLFMWLHHFTKNVWYHHECEITFQKTWRDESSSQMLLSHNNSYFLCVSEITPEGRRITKLDQILLNGNNITMVWSIIEFSFKSTNNPLYITTLTTFALRLV